MTKPYHIEQISRQTYYHICGIVAQYDKMKNRLDDIKNELPMVKTSDSVFVSGGNKTSIQEQVMGMVEKIDRTALAQMVHAVEKAQQTVSRKFSQIYADINTADKLGRAFILNCKGEFIEYLIYEMGLDISVRSFSRYKAQFVLEIAKSLGYIGDIQEILY
jgi:hypothetical protein